MAASDDKKRSFIWNYFTVVDDRVANCNKCKTKITLPMCGTTSSMINHLKASHNDLYKEFMGTSNEAKKSKTEYKKVRKIVLFYVCIATIESLK